MNDKTQQVLLNRASGYQLVLDPAEPSLTAFELTGGRYELAAKVTGDDVFSAQRPFAVEVRPSDLVARLRRAGPPPDQAT